MLVVIAIIGIVAAISVPAINNFRKADAVAAATRQLLDDMGRARQLAISQRTDVYMVFVPEDYWTDPDFTGLPAADQALGDRLLDKQLTGYTFISQRNVGDQPGRNRPRYLEEWRTLPEGIFIPRYKFNPRNPANTVRITDPVSSQYYDVRPFDRTDTIPFPAADALSGSGRFVGLPYIGFNHLGQLISDEAEEIIPIARGSASAALDPVTKRATRNPPTLTETPPGNSTNAFSLIVVDRLTGRARVERQKIQ